MWDTASYKTIGKARSLSVKENTQNIQEHPEKLVTVRNNCHYIYIHKHTNMSVWLSMCVYVSLPEYRPNNSSRCKGNDDDDDDDDNNGNNYN